MTLAPQKKLGAPLAMTATQITDATACAATGLVRLRRGVPVTDSLAIAREFDVRHDNVLRALGSLIADGTICQLTFEVAEYLDGQGKPRRMIELTERGALIAMPFIGGRHSRVGQVRLVDAFLVMRERLTEQASQDWANARRESAINYAAVSEMLALHREAVGKATQSHHFANEARLINFALCGQYSPLDRRSLSKSDLRILAKLEIRDCALIGMGKSYGERKTVLVAYAASLRAELSNRLLGVK